MATSLWNRYFKSKSRPAALRRPASRLRVEELEARLQPAAFFFSTGLPDAKVATTSEPANAHNSHVEYESADDFILNTETKLQRASFTGLLTGGATPKDVSDVVVEIYRVFPNGSDVDRTSGPPTFSTDKVPTRVNSPSDVALDSRDSADQELRFHARLQHQLHRPELGVQCRQDRRQLERQRPGNRGGSGVQRYLQGALRPACRPLLLRAAGRPLR
jgi:hypothetical protein